MINFEKYLEEYCWEPEGVLDDDMPDAFEAWITNLDVQEVMDYADRYGNYCESIGFERARKIVHETLGIKTN